MKNLRMLSRSLVSGAFLMTVAGPVFGECSRMQQARNDINKILRSDHGHFSSPEFAADFNAWKRHGYPNLSENDLTVLENDMAKEWEMRGRPPDDNGPGGSTRNFPLAGTQAGSCD